MYNCKGSIMQVNVISVVVSEASLFVGIKEIIKEVIMVYFMCKV